MDSIRQNDIKFEKSGQVWVRTPDTVRTARKAAKSGETRAPCQEIWSPAVLVDGLVRVGEQIVFGGASKSFKSWAALDLAVCVASQGQDWLGRSVTSGRVLVVNLELPRWCIRRRLLEICEARGVTLDPNRLLVWTLRGENLSAEELRLGIRARRLDGLSLIIPDPVYRLLAQRDENSARDINQLLGELAGVSRDTGAAVLYPAHFAKGNAASKDSMDRVSGSGVFARHPDSLLTLTRHEEDGCFTLESNLRTFPPACPCVVRWQHPLFRVDDQLDPENLRRPRPGPKRRFTTADVLRVIADSTPDNPVSLADWAKKLGARKSTISDYTPELQARGLIATVGDGNSARRHITDSGRAFLDAE